MDGVEWQGEWGGRPRVVPLALVCGVVSCWVGRVGDGVLHSSSVVFDYAKQSGIRDAP